MLPRCVESNKRKCDEYWPAAGSTLKFADNDNGAAIHVTGVETSKEESWHKRDFVITMADGSHSLSGTPHIAHIARITPLFLTHSPVRRILHIQQDG